MTPDLDLGSERWPRARWPPLAATGLGNGVDRVREEGGNDVRDGERSVVDQSDVDQSDAD
jgi:hypothetical protein